MTGDQANEPHGALVASLRDYFRRRAAGESPRLADYAESLGDDLPTMDRLIRARTSSGEAPFRPDEQAVPCDFEHFVLIQEIGRGAMGVVYEAFERELERVVALKVLTARPESDGEMRSRFAAEIRAVARVRHPSIVEIYAHGGSGEHLYYAMSLVEGPSLAELVAIRGEPISVQELTQGGKQIAQALAALHAAGIVHRDVKPQNVMVAPDGRWILADFGLARITGAQTLTTTGQIVGTPLYLSPEQVLAKRDDIDGRTDIYGFGATLYELVSGKPPFIADQIPALLHQIVAERPAPPSQHRNDISSGVDRILLKCLEKEREDRYQTADELIADLEALEAGESVRGRPVSGVRLKARQARRNWLRLTLAGVVLVAPLIWALTYFSGPAWLRLTTVREASISIDGGAPAVLREKHPLEPGRRAIVISAPRYHDRRLDVTLGARDTHAGVIALQMKDRGDREACAEVSALLGYEILPIDPHETAVDTTRGHRRTTFVPLSPRGRVTLADAATMRFGVERDLPSGSQLLFMIGEEEVHSEPIAFTTAIEVRPLPDSVLSRLAPGNVLTWGVQTPDKREWAATADIVPDLPDVQAQLRAKLGEQVSDGLRDDLIVRALLAQNRVSAALAYLEDRRSRGLLSEANTGLLRATLRRLFPDEEEALFQSAIWRALNGENN